MIPQNITKEHVAEAIKEINASNRELQRRKSRKFFLIVDDKEYPPKYVLSLANKYANGEELNPELFGGGNETNTFLEKLGFKVIERSIPPKTSSLVALQKSPPKKSQASHTERCPNCKKTIEQMLRKMFSDVKVNHSFDLGSLGEEFKATPFVQDIHRIFTSLQKYRGHKNFVRAKKLPPCDFFIPSPGFIVEFDESQHFTWSRAISLEKYPENLALGFTLKRWIDLCGYIDAEDNDPPFRDEQRAWYDTLRDFLPAMLGLKPTIRLFSRDLKWCCLDPGKTSDINLFKAVLMRELHVDVRQDDDPFMARIIIAGDWTGDLHQSQRMLQQVCEKWPEGEKVNVLITCGAFLTFPWPKTLPHVRNNLSPNSLAIKSLISAARKQCDLLLTKKLIDYLRKHTHYLTIGVDSYKDRISLSYTSLTKPHVELVALIDLDSIDYHWTGKSYPTPGQELGLLRFPNLESHFIDLPMGRTMILGCHDLNVFHPRGKAVAKKEWRKAVQLEFAKIVKEKKPAIVLHHPHTTDSPKIWKLAINELFDLTDVKYFISAGRYFWEDGARACLDDVLAQTKRGNSLDFIVSL